MSLRGKEVKKGGKVRKKRTYNFVNGPLKGFKISLLVFLGTWEVSFDISDGGCPVDSQTKLPHLFTEKNTVF